MKQKKKFMTEKDGQLSTQIKNNDMLKEDES